MTGPCCTQLVGIRILKVTGLVVSSCGDPVLTEVTAGARHLPEVDGNGIVVAVKAVDESLNGGLVQVAQVAGCLAGLLPQYHGLWADEPEGVDHHLPRMCRKWRLNKQKASSSRAHEQQPSKLHGVVRGTTTETPWSGDHSRLVEW